MDCLRLMRLDCTRYGLLVFLGDLGDNEVYDVAFIENLLSLSLTISLRLFFSPKPLYRYITLLH